MSAPSIAVVVPCYRVGTQILSLLARIGQEVRHVIVVDDCCPQNTGELVSSLCRDPRITVITHETNLGVGGAVMTGYRRALQLGADVVVKLDGDGQMDPALIHRFVRPILEGQADYTKGNRFNDIEDVRTMPPMRLLGNAGLSFFTKASSGYWTVFDPTNGYTAIHSAVLRQLPFGKIRQRYFFESDMLFRLSTIRAHVLDVPMAAFYGEERSNLHVSRVIPQFLAGNLVNTIKRICYNYFLRDFSIASIELVLGLGCLLFGIIFGSCGWWESVRTGITASTGTVMVAALPVIVGVQLLLSFLAFDIAAVPRRALHPMLARATTIAAKRDVDLEIVSRAN